MVLQPATNYHVIPRKGEALTWESPGTMVRCAVQAGELYQEIATSHRTAMLLAMTVVIDTRLHTSICSYKRSFIGQKTEKSRL